MYGEKSQTQEFIELVVVVVVVAAVVGLYHYFK